MIQLKFVELLKKLFRKRFLITLILSFVLSIIEVEGKSVMRSANPIILRAEQTPSYTSFFRKIIRDYLTRCILVN